MIDPNIALQEKGPDFGQLGQGINMGLQNVGQIQQIQQQHRTLEGQKALRGVLSTTDFGDPNAMQNVVQEMSKAGYGDIGQQYAQERQQQQGVISGQKITQAGQTQSQTQELEDRFKTQAMIHGMQALQTKDPDARNAIKNSLSSWIDSQAQLYPPDSPHAKLLVAEKADVNKDDWNDDNNLKHFQTLSVKSPEDLITINNVGVWPTLSKQLSSIASGKDAKGADIPWEAKAKKIQDVMSQYPNMYGYAPAEKFLAQFNQMKPSMAMFSQNGELTPQQKVQATLQLKKDWNEGKASYEKQVTPFLNLMSASKSAAAGTGLGDQALIDEWIRLQTAGNRPSGAQYLEAKGASGISDMIDQATGKLKTGAKLSSQMRKEIVDIAKEEMRTAHERTLALRDETVGQVKSVGGDPNTAVESSRYFDKVGNLLNPPTANPANDPTFKSFDEAYKNVDDDNGFWVDGKHYVKNGK